MKASSILLGLLLPCAYSFGAFADDVSPNLKSRANMSVDGRTIVYDGEAVRLARQYANYGDYESDPNNIAPSELKHVERLMTNAALGRTFPTRAAASSEFFAIHFPGYSLWGLQTPSADVLSVLACEIPHTGKNRYVAIVKDGDVYRIADDFVAPDDLHLHSVERRDNALVYSDLQGRSVLTHPIAAQQADAKN